MLRRRRRMIAPRNATRMFLFMMVMADLWIKTHQEIR